MLSVLTWNVAGRVRSVAAQADAIAERSFDVVTLQEVRSTACAAWQRSLTALGYKNIAATLPAEAPKQAPERRLGVMVASRLPMEVVPSPEMPWSERHLAVLLELGDRRCVLHNLHVPISSKAGRAKVLTLEAVYSHLVPRDRFPSILVGDLNTPQYESREGHVRTFARTRAGNLRLGFDQRHDDAELAILAGLQEWGFVDAFRELHGFERRDRSWLYPNGKAGFRLDHILARGLEVHGCDYIHQWRMAGLSDHSAMWADVEPINP